MVDNSNNLKKILVFVKPYHWPLVKVVFCTIVIAILASLPPLINRALVDEVFVQHNTEHLVTYSVAVFGVWVVHQLICLYSSQLMVWIGCSFVNDVRNEFYRHILGMSLRFFGKQSAGKLVNRLMDDTNQMHGLISTGVIQAVSDFIIAAFSLVAAFWISWRLTLFLLLLMVLFVINYRMNVGRIRKYTKILRTSEDRLSGSLQNRLVVDLAIKTFGAEQRENAIFAQQSAAVVEYGKHQRISNNNFSMNVNLLNLSGYALLYFIGCSMFLRGDLSYGAILAFSQYATQLFGPALRFSNLVAQLEQVAISADRVFEIFDEKSEVTECKNPVKADHLQGRVDFEDVHFHYVPGIEIISGFTLHVNPGDSIALIGGTGCGKSTTLNLLARYYDITGGRLLIDGIPIDRISLKSLRRNLGIVLQESHLFSVSLRDNIRYGVPDATDEEVEQAAKAAEIHDFIMTLPEGYDTMAGETGIALSVGQKQRINIARAICANPSIMIMDEATSSLDSDSELAIQRAMERLLKGRTSFVVAHRLSTIRNSSQIILLDKGRIREQGTHEELMAIPDGCYRELYTTHIGKGVLED